MATNLYFSQKVKSEQNLYEDIVIESLNMYGQDVYYLPRDLVNEDKILGDDPESSFNSWERIIVDFLAYKKKLGSLFLVKSANQ